MPNPTLLDPSTHAGTAFDRTDQANATVAALLSAAPRGQVDLSRQKPNIATTWLTDGAADVFPPGWDTSMFSDANGPPRGRHGEVVT
jgi:hypothetical protein